MDDFGDSLKTYAGKAYDWAKDFMSENKDIIKTVVGSIIKSTLP